MANVIERDVIQHSGAYADGVYLVGSTSALITRTNIAAGTSLLDPSTNLLTGAARTQYLGTHGCEI
jgi:hypothetical protein